MKKVLKGALGLIAMWQVCIAQTGPVFGNYNDGIYEKENTQYRRAIPYPYVREADVMWEKRVWREIDLREKFNLPLYYPTENINGRTSLLQCLRRALFRGEIMAFDDEEFKVPLEPSKWKAKMVRCDSNLNYEVDTLTGEEVAHNVWLCDSVSIFEKVTRIRVKEDWFFDKQRSVMECRILGLCPMEYDEARDFYKPLFWVYFPACRDVFANTEVYNPRNDAAGLSLDDVFRKRMFHSIIVKESNVYDRYIIEYAKGIDALLESERIKEGIFIFEHDLWHF